MFFPTRKYTTLLEKFSRPALGTSVQVLAQIGEFPRLFREPRLLHCLLELAQSRLEDVGHSFSDFITKRVKRKTIRVLDYGEIGFIKIFSGMFFFLRCRLVQEFVVQYIVDMGMYRWL